MWLLAQVDTARTDQFVHSVLQGRSHQLLTINASVALPSDRICKTVRPVDTIQTASSDVSNVPLPLSWPPTRSAATPTDALLASSSPPQPLLPTQSASPHVLLARVPSTVNARIAEETAEFVLSHPL